MWNWPKKKKPRKRRKASNQKEAKPPSRRSLAHDNYVIIRGQSRSHSLSVIRYQMLNPPDQSGMGTKDADQTAKT